MYAKYAKGATISIQGRIRSIEYTKEDTVKSITVGNVLCYVNSNFNYNLHDYVNLTGTASTFKKPLNFGSFNPSEYYASQNVYCYVNNPSIKLLKPAKCLASRLLTLRNKASKDILKYCQFESGTIITLLLGDKRFLNEDRKSLYQLAGVAHFLVISGLHISAIGSGLYKLSRRIFKRKPVAIIISASFLVTYGIAVGFGISVIRAIIMYLLKLFSYLLKETYDTISATCLAGTITLLAMPYSVSSPAFIYSYATVFIIGFYIEYLERAKEKRAPILKRLISNLRLPAFLSVCMAPINLYLAFSYQPMSAFINLLLLPFSAPILLIAALAFLASILNLGKIAMFWDFILTVLLRLLDLLCKLVVRIPNALILGKPKALEMIIFYIVLAFLIFLYIKKLLPEVLYLPAVSILVLLLLSPSLYIPKLSMLYVGQGECVVIRTGFNRAIIMDCGSSTEKELADNTVIPFLKASGISRIEAVYASHSDIDHISGISELIELAPPNGIKLCKLFIPNTRLFYDEEGVNLLTVAKEKSIPVYALSGGDVVYGKAFVTTCLWPITSDGRDANEDSLVNMISLHNINILITGDITVDTEAKLMDTYTKTYLSKVDILKLAHHGSKSSSGENFLTVVSPKLAIISAGINNRYHHPSDEVTKRLDDLGIPYKVTSELGEIDLICLLSHLNLRSQLTLF